MPKQSRSSRRMPWDRPASDSTSYSDRRQPKGSPYNNAKWKAYSRRHRSARLICVACERPHRLDQLVTDHIIPVNDGGAFWDQRNHQCMCHSCHNSKSASEKHGSKAPYILNERGEKIPEPVPPTSSDG